MYNYPEYLNACQRVAVDLMTRAHQVDPDKFPFSPDKVHCTVAADSLTGTASVDWRVEWGRLYVTINMPVKAATYAVTEAEFQHGIAYLLHEVGHPLHTCKATWDKAVATKRHNLLNSLEDVREEKATIDLGLAVNATLMFGSLIDSLHAKAIAKGYDPNDLRSIGWTLSLMGRKANGYAVDTSDVACKLDPNGTVATILGWALPDLAQCRSTLECLDLADRVTAAIRVANKPKPQPLPEPKPEPQPEPEPEPDEVDEGDDLGDADEPTPFEPDVGEGDDVPADTEFEGQGAGKADDNEPVGEERGDRPGRRNDLDDPDAEPQPEPEPEPQPEPQVPADDLVDEVDMTPNKTEVLTSADGNSYAAARRLVIEVRRQLNQPLRDKPIVGRAVRTGYHGETSVDFVTTKANKMGRQRALLAAAMKREEVDDYEGGRMSGRLDRRAMSRLVMGNPHVFGKRTVTEGYDTDVQVLIDGSTSMAGGKMLAAATLGLVVSQAAAQVGVECSAHVFNENGLHAITKGRAKPLGKRFAYAYNQVNGCTPLTQNMLAVAFEQKRRAPNKRRVLFLITDGGCDLGPDVLKAAGRYVEGVVGTEVANIHIGWKAMGVFRSECAVKVDQVEATGLQTLTSVLERGAR